jgi:hypothetical protein
MKLKENYVRTEAYTYLNKPIYPCKTHVADEWITMEQTLSYSDAGRSLMGYDKYDKDTGLPL